MSAGSTAMAFVVDQVGARRLCFQAVQHEPAPGRIAGKLSRIDGEHTRGRKAIDRPGAAGLAARRRIQRELDELRIQPHGNDLDRSQRALAGHRRFVQPDAGLHGLPERGGGQHDGRR